jgi:hypothetical protein
VVQPKGWIRQPSKKASSKLGELFNPRLEYWHQLDTLSVGGKWIMEIPDQTQLAVILQAPAESGPLR